MPKVRHEPNFLPNNMFYMRINLQFSSVQSLSRVRLFATLWIAARQASLSITNSWSSLKRMSIELVMPSSHLILCCPLLLPPIPPSIRVFSNESTLRMRWPKYWSFSFSISPSSEHPGLISFRMDWLYLLAVQRKPYVNPLQGSPTLGPSTGSGPVRNGVRSRRWVAGDKKVGVHCRALDKFSRMKTKIIYMSKTP